LDSAQPGRKIGIETKMGERQKNIYLLGLVSFINDTASNIILPILPFFIDSIGGGGLAVGLISGLGESVASLFKMLSGYWSDKLGKRKPFVFYGYLTAAISKFMFAFAQTWPHVLVLKVAERFGKGLRAAPRDAILAASTEKEKRGKGFGIHRAMDSGGAVLGSVLAFVLFWYLGLNFREIFLAAGVIAVMSLIPLFSVKEKVSEKKKTSLKIGLKGLQKPLRVFMVIAALFALGNFSYMFFVLKSEIYFEGRLAIGIPILLYVLYNTSYTVFAIPSGILSDKIGRRYVLFTGYGLFGLVCIGFIYADSLLFFMILFILFGLNYALVNANERAFVSDLAQEELRGTALGTFHMLTSTAALPAGIFVGFIWDMDTTYPFIYGAVISLLVLILFLILCRYCRE
jgi:MFS family permease